MIFHPDVPHEVGRPAVRHPDGPAPLLRREVPVHHVAAPAFVKGQIGRGLVLEGPEPAVLSAHVDPRLIRSGNLSGRDLPADHLVRLLRDPLHGVQHVGHGPLADVEPEDGLEQVREPLERDVLIGAEVRGERHDVGAEGYRGVHVLGEPALAAVAAGALHPHLEMPVTTAMIGSGMSTTCLVAAIVANSMSSGLPHTGQTAAGYQRSVPVTSPDCGRVLP